MSIKGQDVLARAVSSLPFEVDREVLDTIDQAVTEEYQRQRAEIPFYEGTPYTDKYGRHGGPLRDSLTDRADPFHVAQVVGDQVVIGTDVEYARYNELPEPDDRAVERALLALLLLRLREGR